MEAFKLLSRSTGLKSSGSKIKHAHKEPIPSTGHAESPQLFTDTQTPSSVANGHSQAGRKRKRSGASPGTPPQSDESPRLSLSGQLSLAEWEGKATTTNPVRKLERFAEVGPDEMDVNNVHVPAEEECRRILNDHKVKILDLSSLRAMETVTGSQVSKKKSSKPDMIPKSRKKQKQASRLYPAPLTNFAQLRARWSDVPTWLLTNIAEQGYKVPTEVQLATVPILLGQGSMSRYIDLLTVAPTGSGKTLAFLIGLIYDVVKSAADVVRKDGTPCLTGLIVAPTKEIANQTVMEGQKLLAGSGIRISLPSKGFSRFGEGAASILVTTPQSFLNLLNDDTSDPESLSSIRHLVLDEADVLLDPLFREQTLAIWDVCHNPHLRVSFWSATMGSNIESFVQAKISERCLRLSLPDSRPLIRVVVGLKDSALPTVSHKLVYAATEAGKLLGLRQLLHPTSSIGVAPVQALRPPFLVFTQTISRAIALHSELLYDIPISAGGTSRIAVLHSDLTDQQRFDVMVGVRKGQIWVLITTDLLSRGVDFRGVNGVVNYDIPTSSAAYVHRAGRTGRAGREGGVCVTFYTKGDIPYVKSVANVIAMSAKAGKVQGGDGTGGVQKWLLDALPDLSKKEKKELKRHGVKARRMIAEGDSTTDAKVKRRSRISTKSGYERRLENNRKGAKLASQGKIKISESEESSDDFEGFRD